ncbi:MAG: hypothetical protein ACLPH3_17420 [Terracidiphilus sp.]
MKTAILLAVFIVILSSLPIVSRQTTAAAQENTSPAVIPPAHPESFSADNPTHSGTVVRTDYTEPIATLTPKTTRARETVAIKTEEQIKIDANSMAK